MKLKCDLIKFFRLVDWVNFETWISNLNWHAAFSGINLEWCHWSKGKTQDWLLQFRRLNKLEVRARNGELGVLIFLRILLTMWTWRLSFHWSSTLYLRSLVVPWMITGKKLKFKTNFVLCVEWWISVQQSTQFGYFIMACPLGFHAVILASLPGANWFCCQFASKMTQIWSENAQEK